MEISIEELSQKVDKIINFLDSQSKEDNKRFEIIDKNFDIINKKLNDLESILTNHSTETKESLNHIKIELKKIL